MVNIAHEIYRNGLTPGLSGNISLKIPDINEKKKKSPHEHRTVILISPSGVSLKDINLKNIIVTDTNGNQLDGEGEPSSELYMHLGIYKTREDVQGIVHTHSPYATGFSFTDKKIPLLEGFGKIKEPYINIIDYAPPGSDELVELATQGVKKDDILILKDHGLLAVASNIENAANLAFFAENCAKTGFVSLILNKII
ncbi:MAG: class II aldolase/adducin family protein [Methanobacterium sp.]|nr:class II aldolase/adducin family protein [Methanobacterium sp.]